MKAFKTICVFSMIILSFQVRAQEKKWQFRTPMPTPRSGITAVVFEGRICVMGGRDRKGKILDKVEIYDPVTDSWDTSFKHLKHQRENAAAVVFDGKIVVLGGRDDDGEITDKVEFFNPAKNKWENLESLIEDREGLAAVVLDGDLYALGGLGERKDREIFLNSVEIYNPANDSWSIHDDWRLQKPRASFAVAVAHDSVYSIGGFKREGPLAAVERYHVAVGNTERSTLSVSRGGLAGVVSENIVFALGGKTFSDSTLRSVEYFELEKNIWQEGVAFKIAREKFATVVFDNYLYIFGGQDSASNKIASVECIPVELVTGVETIENSTPPETIALKQNYPNPFNAGTKIQFSVAVGNGTKAVKLNIYNIKGQFIVNLVDEPLLPGEYQVAWDGMDHHGLPASSGVYFYVLQQGDRVVESQKMTLVK